jgi:hypothetical protein
MFFKNDDTAAGLGGAETSLGGAEMSLDGAEMSLGGAEMSLGGAEMSLDGAETSLDGAKMSLDGAKMSLGGAKMSLGGAEMSLGGAETGSDDRFSVKNAGFCRFEPFFRVFDAARRLRCPFLASSRNAVPPVFEVYILGSVLV